MRSPGRFASEQISEFVLPESMVPDDKPRDGPGAGVGAAAGAGTVDAGAAGAGAGAGAGVTVGTGVGAGAGRDGALRGVRTGLGPAARGALGDDVIAVSPIAALGVADVGASAEASVRSRASSESTDADCLSFLSHAISSDSRLRPAKVLFITRFSRTDRKSGNSLSSCRSHPTTVGSEMSSSSRCNAYCMSYTE